MRPSPVGAHRAGKRSIGARMGDAPPEESTPVAGRNLPLSLEEKMKSWEPTEEERKAATLGGLTPAKLDGFELSLNIIFPLMLVSCIAVALFPLFSGNIDVSQMEVPPTQ